METGERFDVRARRIINATGVWSDEAQESADTRPTVRVRASKGVHLVVPRDRIASQRGLVLRTERSVLFVIPWGTHWIIGTTDTEWDLDKAHPAASSADIDYLLGHVNSVLARPLSRDDIEGIYADYGHWSPAIRRPPPNSPGSLVSDVLQMIAADPSLGMPLESGGGYLRAEAVYAATHEGALHLEDVLTRRTRISVETSHRGVRCADEVAALIAGPLGWNTDHHEREVEAYLARVEAELDSPHRPDDQSASTARLAAHEINPDRSTS